ncbi:MAG: hypothetical protein K0S25_1674 [Bacillus sp. (in: firmicutes)]|jgi:hypothetical protein|nr:hypothetical protein [Bacillus sp. 1NLA3E]MDF2904036.1 hypothetical protein [Bacillus sp. (in: firmicutes)]
MIKKWVFGAIAYLIVVMIGFGIYNSTVDPKPMNQHQQENMK